MYVSNLSKGFHAGKTSLDIRSRAIVVNPVKKLVDRPVITPLG
jgi:hypothetical protein